MIEQDRSFAFFICRGQRQPQGYDSLIARLIRSHDGRRRSISHVPMVVPTMARQSSVRDLYESCLRCIEIAESMANSSGSASELILTKCWMYLGHIDVALSTERTSGT